MSDSPLDEPRFEPPFANIVCPVITPQDHRGYRHLVAHHVGMGVTAPGVIIEACAKAAADQAPLDVVFQAPPPEDAEPGTEGAWITLQMLSRPANIEMIELYVEAMTIYERKLEEYTRDRFEAGEEFVYTLTFPSTTTVTVRAPSLSAAHVKLAPVDGRLHHEVRQVEPAFPGTMRVQLDRANCTLIATDDPALQKPPPRRTPLSA